MPAVFALTVAASGCVSVFLPASFAALGWFAEPLGLIKLLAGGGENKGLAAFAANHDFVVSCSQHHFIPALRAGPEMLSLLIT